MKPKYLRIATYNIHGCIGRDGQFAPDRIGRIIGEIGADVIALQEVSSGPVGAEGIAVQNLLAEAFGGHSFWAPTLDEEGRAFGNLLLSRWPIASRASVDISYRQREPHNAIDASIEAPSGGCRVIATHLGLNKRERLSQAQVLRRRIDEIADSTPVILIGDFNVWHPFSRVMRTLGQVVTRCPRIATYPTLFPIFALDAIMVRGLAEDVIARRHDTTEAKIASDHFPLVAEIPAS